LPILAFHRRLLWLIGAGMFFDSFDIYLAGSLLGELVHSGWSSIELNARFISATFGITSTVGRLTTIFVPFGVIALFDAGGVAAVVLSISVALVVQALLAAAYNMETNGRSLEAITLQ